MYSLQELKKEMQLQWPIPFCKQNSLLRSFEDNIRNQFLALQHQYPLGYSISRGIPLVPEIVYFCDITLKGISHLWTFSTRQHITSNHSCEGSAAKAVEVNRWQAKQWKIAKEFTQVVVPLKVSLFQGGSPTSVVLQPSVTLFLKGTYFLWTFLTRQRLTSYHTSIGSLTKAVVVNSCLGSWSTWSQILRIIFIFWRPRLRMTMRRRPCWRECSWSRGWSRPSLLWSPPGGRSREPGLRMKLIK